MMLEAGAIALGKFGQVDARAKADFSLVTDADLEVEFLLQKRLGETQKDGYFLGEESIAGKSESYIEESLKGEAWVVDPIDGTVNYASGLGLWGISVGLMEDSHFSHGCIYLPALGELFISVGDAVEHGRVEDGKIVRRVKLSGEKILDNDHALIAITQSLSKRGRIDRPNPVHTIAAAVYPLSQIVRGAYLAYIGKLQLWDVAGGLPLAHRVGLEVGFIDGRRMNKRIDGGDFHLAPGLPQRWGVCDLMVICRPDMFDTICHSVEP